MWKNLSSLIESHNSDQLKDHVCNMLLNGNLKYWRVIGGERELWAGELGWKILECETEQHHLMETAILERDFSSPLPFGMGPSHVALRSWFFFTI